MSIAKSTKYIRELGTSVVDIAKRFSVTQSTVYGWLRNQEKTDWLKRELTNMRNRKE